MRRYGKEAKLQEELNKVPNDILEYGRARASNIASMFQFPHLVPPLPRRHGL